MNIETYLKNRESFLKQYSKLIRESNKMEGVKLKSFKIWNFREFIFLYSIDNVSSIFSNIVSSIEPKKFYVKYPKKPATRIYIEDKKMSLFDKFPEQFEIVQPYYVR